MSTIGTDAPSASQGWARQLGVPAAFAAATAVPALIVSALPPTLWDEVTGLPGHPLVVHLAVVLVPVAATLVGAAGLRRSLRPRMRRALPPLLAVTAVATMLAKRTGDSLSAAVGLPAMHAEWGNNLLPLVVALAVAGTLLLWLAPDESAVVRIVDRVLSPLVGVAAVTAIFMTVWVGHTGADAAWDGVLDEARRPPSSATGSPAVITAADVAQRSTPDACWTVVDGLVYDLTAFIARHPAGQEAILEMCGRDASEDYRDEHEGQPEPAEWLAVFHIGELTR